jgi:hypothetical protein
MENSLSFLDVFDEKFLDKVYNAFEKHVNKPFFDQSFFTTVCFDLLAGEEWDKIKKVMHDFETVPSLENIASFLVAHCFTVWFAKKNLENKKFNILEKTCLVGWVSFYESEQPEGSCPETAIVDVREDDSEKLVNEYFEKVIEAYSEDYQNFLNDGGDGVVN